MLPVWFRAGLVTIASVSLGEAARAQQIIVTDSESSSSSLSALNLTPGQSEDIFVSWSAAPTEDVAIYVNYTLDKYNLVTIDEDQRDLTMTTTNWEDHRITVTALDVYPRDATWIMWLDFVDPDVPLDDPDSLFGSLLVNVTDDRRPGIVLSNSDLSVESGETLTFEIGLAVRPLEGENVIIDLSADGSPLVQFEPDRVEFVYDGWNPKVIEVTASADLEGTASIVASINDTSTDEDYRDTVDDASVSVTVTDTATDEDPPPDRPPEDPGGAASSVDTSLGVGSAVIGAVSAATQGALRPRRHGFGTGAPSQAPDEGGDPPAEILTVVSAREGDKGLSLLDWFATGLVQESVDADLVGDGTVAYAMIGTELTRTQAAVSGLLYGLETSSWDYEDETDLDKTGLFGGYYVGRTWDRLLFSGAAVLTVANNAYTADDGASADTTSWRLMFTGSVSDERRLDSGAFLAPYASFMYANEILEAFTFSDGTSSDEDRASVGEISVGVEYLTAPDPHLGQFLVRGSLDKVFGTDAITLSTGETYSPNDDVAGSVTFGWLPHLGTDSAMSLELTIGQLGNEEKTEVRMDGTWDRQF